MPGWPTIHLPTVVSASRFSTIGVGHHTSRVRANGLPVGRYSLNLHARRVEAADAWSAGRHDDTLDHQPNELPPLLEVRLGPEGTGIGVQDDALLVGGVRHSMQSVDLALQLGSDRSYRPSPSTPRT